MSETRLRMPSGVRSWRLMCVVGLTLLGAGDVAPAVADAGVISGLERRLELERHARLAAAKAKPGARLSAFESDGCSGGLSVGWDHIASVVQRFRNAHGARPPWEACCVEHDRLYHPGGSAGTPAERSFAARLEADVALKVCVRAFGEVRADELAALYDVSPDTVRTIYTRISELMFWAVRLGGAPCTGLPWRWGYGWPECAARVP